MSDLLPQIIAKTAQATPDAEALTYRGTRMSYGELQQIVDNIAAGLHSLGLVAGERVAIYLPKQLETVQALFGAAQAGGIVVPINPLLKAQQVAHILNDCEARVLVTSADRAKFLADVLPDCPTLQHIITTDETELAFEPPPELTLSHWQSLLSERGPVAVHLTGDSTAAILYTSGSTGRPKGVALSHRNMVLGAHSVAQYLDTRAADRVLAVLPLSFDYGLSQLTTAFHAGATAVLMNYLLPQDVLRAVSQERITTLAGVPSLWMQLAPLAWPKEAAERLRTITNSGGHLPTSVINRLQERLPATQLFLMYGLTEAFRSSYLPPAELAARPTSMGKAIPHAELAVVRPDGSLCKPGEAGELVHAGPLVAQGYWNNPDKTAQHFRPLPAALVSDDPNTRAVWSGDTVTMDKDGYLYFLGREDDMIKTSGYRVSPNEIEEVVHATGLVQEVAAIGVPHPSLGQAIVVVAIPKTPTGVAEMPQQILDHSKKALPTFMLPQHISLDSQLPKTANGKIDRHALKRTFDQHFTKDP